MVQSSLTLKKVKFDIIKRFAGHVFLYIGYTCENSRTSNKQMLSPLQMVDPSLTLKDRGDKGEKNQKIHRTQFPIC